MNVNKRSSHYKEAESRFIALLLLLLYFDSWILSFLNCFYLSFQIFDYFIYSSLFIFIHILIPICTFCSFLSSLSILTHTYVQTHTGQYYDSVVVHLSNQMTDFYSDKPVTAPPPDRYTQGLSWLRTPVTADSLLQMLSLAIPWRGFHFTDQKVTVTNLSEGRETESAFIRSRSVGEGERTELPPMSLFVAINSSLLSPDVPL